MFWFASDNTHVCVDACHSRWWHASSAFSCMPGGWCHCRVSPSIEKVHKFRYLWIAFLMRNFGFRCLLRIRGKLWLSVLCGFWRLLFSHFKTVLFCMLRQLILILWSLGSKEKVIPIISLLLSRMEDNSAAVRAVPMTSEYIIFCEVSWNTV